MTRESIFRLLTLALSLMIPSAAVACKCSSIPGLPAALNQAGAVFTGKVRAVKPARPGEAEVTFDVTRAWQGVDATRVKVFTETGTSCGIGFTVGRAWLVYAQGTGRLTTHMCSRTAPLSLPATRQELKLLGKGYFPVQSGPWPTLIVIAGAICGVSVLLYKRGNR